MSEYSYIEFREIYFAVHEREVSYNAIMVLYIKSSTQFWYWIFRVKCECRKHLGNAKIREQE
jgi:hypothetical protein